MCRRHLTDLFSHAQQYAEFNLRCRGVVPVTLFLLELIRDGKLRDLLGRLPTDIVWRALEEQTA